MTRPVEREFFPEDISRIKTALVERERLEKMDLLALGRKYKESGPCMTLTMNGEPVAAGGFSLLWPGTAELWAVINEGCKPGVLLALKRNVEKCMSQYGLNCLCAMACSAWGKGCRFLEWLGFENEGDLSGWAIYARMM
jgi:hypothetical protein